MRLRPETDLFKLHINCSGFRKATVVKSMQLLNYDHNTSLLEF